MTIQDNWLVKSIMQLLMFLFVISVSSLVLMFCLSGSGFWIIYSFWEIAGLSDVGEPLKLGFWNCFAIVSVLRCIVFIGTTHE